jgi:uncharacterized alpha-E superfamily protein
MLSRVAESLYWMSRYIERAENNARIAEVNLQMLLDLTNQHEADPRQQWDPIISSLEVNELFTSLYPKPDGRAVLDFVSRHPACARSGSGTGPSSRPRP